LAIQATLAAGIALYSVGRLHLKHRATASFARPYVVIGALVTFAVFYTYVLIVTSTGGFYDPRGQSLPGSLAVLQFGIMLIAVALVIGNCVLEAGRVWGSMEAGALVILLMVPHLTPETVDRFAGTGKGTQWLVWLLLANLLYFGASLGAAVLGVHRKDRVLVNIGLTFFAVGIATRYIDVIGKMLNTSLFFIGGGLLLLGGGWLVERTRRRLLKRMEGFGVGA
jgi:uncharacterized membrane protein